MSALYRMVQFLVECGRDGMVSFLLLFERGVGGSSFGPELMGGWKHDIDGKRWVGDRCMHA